MKKINFIFALILAIAFSSCNMVGDLQIEKRHYSKGYYVHVRDNHSEIVVAEKSNAPTTENAVSEKIVSSETSIVENNSALTDAPTKQAKDPNPIFSSTKHHSVFTKNENEKIVSAKNKQEKIIVPTRKPSPQPASDVNQIILVILALIISPLAIYLKEGVTVRFWIDLIAWLLGVGIVGFYFYGGGFLLFAIVFALLIIFDVI